MNVWLVKIGEPVPQVETNINRLFRTGTFSRVLAEHGHQVTWWTTTFDHFQKHHLFQQDTVVNLNDHLTIRMLHACGYTDNVSLKRLRDHRMIATKFASASGQVPPPDIIVAAFPSIELCLACVRYAAKHDVPVLVDVRDPWPDSFAGVMPAILRPLAGVLLAPLYRQTRQVFRECNGIMGICEGYVELGLRHAQRQRCPSDRVFSLGYRRSCAAGHEIEEAGAALRQMGVDAAKTICLFVGSFGRTYDLAMLVEAARQCSEKGIDQMQFVLGGHGETFSEMTALAHGLKNIVFTGWLNPIQIAYLLRVSTIGIMPYVAGALQINPNKLGEYLSAGLPILSTLEGETEELLAQYGCSATYAPGNPEQLVEKLRHLLDNPSMLHAMRAGSERLYLEKFDAERIYQDMMAHLEVEVRADKVRKGIVPE